MKQTFKGGKPFKKYKKETKKYKKVKTKKETETKETETKTKTKETKEKTITKQYEIPTTLQGCSKNYKNPRQNYKIGDYLTRGGSKIIYKVLDHNELLYIEIDAYPYKKVREIFEEFCLYVLLEEQNILVKAYDWKYEKDNANYNNYICSFFIEACDLNLFYKKRQCLSSEDYFFFKEINRNNINNLIEKVRDLNVLEMPKEHELFKYCSLLKPNKTYYNVDYKPENICIFSSQDHWDIKLLDVGLEYLHEIKNIDVVKDYSFLLFFSKLIKWCNKYQDKKNIIIKSAKEHNRISKETIQNMLDTLGSYHYRNSQTPINTLDWYLCLKNRFFEEKCKTKKELIQYILTLFNVEDDDA